MQRPYRVIRSPRHSFRWVLELLWILSMHRISIRYKETLFGFGWIFLQPVALTVIFNYIRRIAHIPAGEVPYPIFTATGLVAWSLTALVVSQSAASLTGHAPVLKRVAFPRIILPLTVVLSSCADMAVMGVLLFGLVIYYQFSLSPALPWLTLVVGIHLLLLIGLSCLISMANVFLRDIGHAIPSLAQLWFFASPVFYPSSMVPEEFKGLAQWNPMTGLIEGYRSSLLLGETPALNLIGPAAVVSAALFGLGVICYVALEGIIADML